MRQAVVIGAFALVSAVAVAGWVRKPEPPPAQAYAAPLPAYPTQFQANPAQPYPPQAFTPLNAYGSPMTAASYAPIPQATNAYYERPVVRPVVRRTSYAAPRHTVVVRKRKRPFTHSLAIVGGSAGAGAAIGALAGGGKGAGIGALAGGAAGLIYDRLTHNK
jgi:uncharacterized protein YcfJ